MSGERSEPGLVPSKTTVPTVVIQNSVESRTARRVAALRKALWGAAHGMALQFRSGVKPNVWMVTLTYAPGVDWKPEHISNALRRLRKQMGAEHARPRYAWVAEMQGRGAVHYHVVLWLPHGRHCEKWDEAGWWPHGMSNRVKAIAPVAYLMKYASKGDNHGVQFPKGIRIYGVGGLSDDGRNIQRWLQLPEWAKRLHGVGDVVRRAGRRVVLATGQVLESPWAVRLLPQGLELRQLRPVAERFHDGPYSTLKVAT